MGFVELILGISFPRDPLFIEGVGEPRGFFGVMNGRNIGMLRWARTGRRAEIST